MKKGKTIAISLVVIFLFIIIGAILYFTGNLQSAVSGSVPIIKYSVPVMATIRCESVDPNGGGTYTISDSGYWIDANNIGGITPLVDNIKVTASQSFFNSLSQTYLLGGTRIAYQICDQNHNNCGSIITQDITNVGDYVLKNLPNSLDVTRYSVFIVIQSKDTIVSSWKNIQSKATISYHFNRYGLELYSPIGVGIQQICATSCSLSCINPGIRKTILTNASDNLGFTGANNVANFISTWVDVSQSADSLGGTQYDSSTGLFCFGGFRYKSGFINAKDNTIYIFPQTYLDKKDCCPGSTLSTASTDQTCQSDYTWKTITKNTIIKCSTDFQCPSQGKTICRNKQLSGYTCQNPGTSSSNCVQNTVNTVQCCTNADCATDMTCSNSYKCVGGSSQGNPVIPTNQTICNSNQTLVNGVCIDNKITCQWYQDKVETNDYGTLGWRHIFNNPITTVSCQTSLWIYVAIVVIAGIFIISVLVGIILIFTMRRKRR